MTYLFLMCSISMTLALLAVSVYCFVSGIPGTGAAILFFSFFSSLLTCNVYSHYLQEQLRLTMIHQMSRIEVVVVPSLLYREGGVIYDIPYAKPVPSSPPLRAQ
jgi:hypothetical protein